MFSPEAFRPVLAKFIRILDDCQTRFLLTGGILAVLYAEPRYTQDVDLVVDREQLQPRLDDFLSALQAGDYLFTPQVVRDAVKQGRMFQVIDGQEMLKLDVYTSELVGGELDRSTKFELFPGLPLPIASRPDLAMSKLIWISKGSHKSRRDLKQILLRATDEETATVRATAEKMSLLGLLDEVLAEPDEIDA
jgi:hypothetical protein